MGTFKARILTGSYNFAVLESYYESPECQPHCKLGPHEIAISDHMLFEYSMLDEIRRITWHQVCVEDLDNTNTLDDTWQTEPNE